MERPSFILYMFSRVCIIGIKHNCYVTDWINNNLIIRVRVSPLDKRGGTMHEVTNTREWSNKNMLDTDRYLTCIGTCGYFCL